MAITKVTDVDVHFDESNSLESQDPAHYSAILSFHFPTAVFFVRW
jgi:hypothetical protein